MRLTYDSKTVDSIPGLVETNSSYQRLAATAIIHFVSWCESRRKVKRTRGIGRDSERL